MFSRRYFKGMYDYRAVALPAILMFLFFLSTPCFAHYPYPSSQVVKQAADKIKKAIVDKNQESVEVLTKMLSDKKARIQTGTLIGIMQLVNEELDFEAAIEAIKQVKKTKMRAPYLIPARDTALILLDKKVSKKERLRKLVKETKDKDGWRRRMAVEAIRPLADKSVLKALEGLAGDPFDTFRSDYFDLRPVSRIAFEVWWPIRSEGLTEDQKLAVLIDTLKHGEPFRSRWCDATCEVIVKEGQRAVGPLIPVARDGDRNSKLWARRTLGQIGGKKAIGALLEFCVADLDSKDRLVRHSSASFISRLADKSILPELAKVLHGNPDPIVRRDVAAGIGLIDGKETISPLRKALKDSEISVRTQAAAELAKKGLSDGDSIILDELDSINGGSEYIAAGAMQFISDKKLLAKRIAEILESKPGKEIQTERQKVRFHEVRRRIIHNLATWDAEVLKPMASILRPALKKEPQSVRAKRILKKLND
jgi:HEAT repeat protein